MKISRVVALAVSLSSIAASMAAAQAAAAPAPGQPGSIIEVYGVIDAAARVSTNASFPGNGLYIGTSQGLFNGSRVGFRGNEALTDSLKAMYALEFGFVLPYGVLDQQGATGGASSGDAPVSAQFFGRQSWVGISGSYGQLTFGRQYGTFTDAYGVGDVFGINHGNMVYATQFSDGSPDAVNSFFLQESGFRWDNSLKYTGSFSGITIGANTAFGNVPNNFMKNSMFAGSVGYATKDLPISGAAGAQYETDQNGLHHSDVGGGVKWALDATDGVYAFYFHSVFDTGFIRSTATNSELSSVSLSRQDEIASVGANYYVMSNLNVLASWYFDYARDVVTRGDNGMRNSVLAALDYYFSKDFDVYLGAWYSLFGGQLKNSKNGGINAFADSTHNAQYPNQGIATPSDLANSFSAIVGARFRF